MASNSVVDIITQVAQQKGVPPALALAIAKWESGLDPNNIGDSGHSVGLFQLNDKGEGSGLSVAQRQDPHRNAEIALSEIARVYHANPNMTWGQIATTAQRPAAYTFPAYHANINAAQAAYQNAPLATVTHAYAMNAPTPSAAANTDPSAGPLGTTPAASAAGAGGAPGTDVTDVLTGQYGYMTAFLNDPELGPILREAAAGGYSDAKLEGLLSQTKWWKTTGATARQWISLNRIDPATAKENLATTQSHVTALAQSSGVKLNPADIYHIAYAANMFGWSDLQMQQAVGAQYKYAPGKMQEGAAGTDIATMKQMAAEYMVPVSDAALQKYAQASLSGNYNINDFEAYVKQQAMSLYAGNKTMTNAITQGIKPTTFVDPYRQLIAQTTEVAPDNINFMDPKYMKFINQIDPKNGTYAPMNLGDVATTLRTNKVYGYDKTAQARQEASNLATSLGQAMGFI